MSDYQLCSNCIMDTSDKKITFGDDGVCSHCHEALKNLPKYSFTKVQEEENIRQIIKTIKTKQNSKYDSIIGLSGGVDSSYVAYLAWKNGINPLCVHFDNGWNTEIAVSNIKKIVDKCGFDLITYVINWPEFCDLQRSFIKAGVVDIEVLTDHAHKAATLRFCKQYKIKHVLTGNNYNTEHGMPRHWAWIKQDVKHIKDIHRQYGGVKLKSYPFLGLFKYHVITETKFGPTYTPLLNKISYKKNEAMEKLNTEFGWEYYGGKHYESVFTKFYQAYILPAKFCIDKRRVHLSALIRNKEISRKDALTEMELPLYDKRELIRDREFVLKKLNFSETEFEQIMQNPPIPHEHFATQMSYMKHIIHFAKILMGKTPND